MNIPSELKYTRDHEWIRLDKQIATIGITDFAQGELGDIVFVEISSKGESLDEHAIFGTVEAVKTVSDLYMPVKGKVIEVNPGIDANPASVNEDPYGEGWMIRVEIEPGTDLSHLLSADEYKSVIS